MVWLERARQIGPYKTKNCHYDWVRAPFGSSSCARRDCRRRTFFEHARAYANLEIFITLFRRRSVACSNFFTFFTRAARRGNKTSPRVVNPLLPPCNHRCALERCGGGCKVRQRLLVLYRRGRSRRIPGKRYYIRFLFIYIYVYVWMYVRVCKCSFNRIPWVPS